MAAKNEAKIKFIAETTEFNEQIKKANQSMTELRSELKLSESQFKDNEKSVEALSEKKRILQEQLEASGEKVEALRKKLDKAKEIYGENSTEVSKLKTQLNNAERQYTELENAIEDTNKDLKDADPKTKAAKEALEELSEAADKSSDGFTVMKGAISNLVSDGINLLIDGLKDASKFVLQTGMDFEAGMSEVKAISGATTDEVEQLTDKAKQMGAITKFSATESAEAFKFMAQAGWGTEQMLGGIEGVMNLAAASGADLATSAEIVTDALMAMGYEASDATHLADVMAQTANASSTDVEQMGYTFKYVAPLVGALGYTMEDLAISTGLMANAGIKSEQAGTTMRAALTNLISPAKTAATKMQGLGFYTEEVINTFDQQKIDQQMLKVEKATLKVDKAQTSYNTAIKKYGKDSDEASQKAMALSIANEELRIASEKLTVLQEGLPKTIYGVNEAVQNQDGSMKSLRDTLVFLREKFANLSEAEQASAASAIFGKEAMSGMLAVINASDENFEKMTLAIDDSEGAAQKMAETMQDNLKGDLEQLGGALETVGLTAYEGFSNPMRQAVQDVTETMSSYDVAKAVNGISYELGNLTQGAADKLPSILNTVVNVASGIIEHIDDIGAGVKAFIITWGLLKALGIGMSIAGIIFKVVSLVAGIASGTITLGAATTAMGGFSAALGMATGGISLLVGGIALAVSWLANVKTSTEKYSEAAATNANVLTEFQWSLTNLQPTLASTNGLLSDSGKTMAQLDAAISETETAITTILSTALSEQRQLRETELQEIAEYNARMAELQAEKLQVYRDQQQSILLQIKNESEMITQQAAAQYIVNLQESVNQSNTISEEAYRKKLLDIENFHKTQGTIDSEAYHADLAAAKEAYNAEIAANQEYTSEALALIADSATKWVGTEADKWESILTESGNSKKKYAKNLSEMNMENSKAFLEMYVEAKAGGAKVSKETEDLAKDMLGAFDNLPKDMDEVGKETLLGLIGGMDKKIPGLEKASEMTADEIVDTLKKELQVNSPSRVTKTIGGYVAEGLAVGMENKKGPLGSRIASFASGLLSKMEKAFGVASPSKMTAEIGGFLSEGLGVGIAENEDAALAPMQGLVDKMRGVDVAGEWNKLSGLGGSLNYDVSAQLGDYVSSAIDNNSQFALLGSLIDAVEGLASRAINLDIDGMRFATATAGASDSVSGSRLNLRNRGIAL